MVNFVSNIKFLGQASLFGLRRLLDKLHEFLVGHAERLANHQQALVKCLGADSAAILVGLSDEVFTHLLDFVAAQSLRVGRLREQ